MKDTLEKQISNSFNLSSDDIIKELLYHHHELELLSEYNFDINDFNETELLKVFNKFIINNSKYISVEEIYNTLQNNYILIDTPDGFNELTDFYKKDKHKCINVITTNHSCKSSDIHKFEKNTQNNWEFTKDLKINDLLLTKNGYENIIELQDLGESTVYDFTVNHTNHRYWGGTGISSHNTGKSFLCYNICREAQAIGYSIIYIDTEFSIQLNQLPGYGIDISKDKFMLMRTNIVEDLKIFTTQMLDSLKEQKQNGKDIGKILIVLDSVGQLASRKEVEDAKDGKEKADMTRAKALASYFRIINSDLGYLNVGFLCTNHTYSTMDMFPKQVLKGGMGLYYSASSIAFLSKAKLQDGEQDELDMNQSGIIVTAKMIKNRMAKPKKVKFEISFVSGCNPFTGLEFWCDENTFDQVGIAKGKFDEKTKEFIPGGNRWYVGHLGKHVATANLFSPQVFTKDVLDNLRPIIQDYFKYKSITELNELNRRLEEAKGNISDKELYSEEMTSDKLFSDSEE